MSQRMTLQELAGHVAPELCAAAHREALAVQEGEIEPPESWRKEIEWLARRYVVRQASVPLWDFDRNDKPIAVTFLGAPDSDAAFHKWMDEVADWRARVAEVRAKWRKCYKHYYRQKPQADARRIVTGRIATAKIEAAEAEVTKLVHTAMTAPDAVVQATAADGTRRQLARAEVLEAIPEIESNSLTIKDVGWRHVEVTLPAATPASEPDSQGEFRSWFDALDAGVTVTEGMAKEAFPDLKVRRRRALLKEVVPEERRAERGTAPSRRRSK